MYLIKGISNSGEKMFFGKGSELLHVGTFYPDTYFYSSEKAAKCVASKYKHKEYGFEKDNYYLFSVITVVEFENESILKSKYPYGTPDNLVYDITRRIGEGSREKWLDFLKLKEFTEDTFEKLDIYARYQYDCEYHRRHNIPMIMD